MKKGLFINLISFTIVMLLILVFCKPVVPAAPTYVVGIVGSMTGPMATTYLPIIDGIRIYLERVNEQGGIDGRKVKILIEDSKSSPAGASMAFRKLTAKGVHLLLAPDGSPTYSAYVAEAKRANIPLIIGGIASPQCYPPTPDPLIYNAMWGTLKTTAVVSYSLAKFGGKGGKAGFLTYNSPAAMMAGDFIVAKGKEFGLADVVTKTIPVRMLDLTPVAIAFKAAGVAAVTSYAAAATNIALADALIKFGYKGKLWLLVPEPYEHYVEKFKGVENVILGIIQIPYFEDWPVAKEIQEAAKKYKVSKVNSGLCFGWDEGVVVEEILKKVGWPVTTEKLVQVMQHLKVKRPLFGTLEWTPEDHGAPLAISNYVWDKVKGAWVPTGVVYWADSYGNLKIFKNWKEIP